MQISLIAGIGNNNELGYDNKLLWRLRADLQNFKKITLGHHILMGRKTNESIGRELPGRVNMILSKDKSFEAPASCLVFDSLQKAIKKAQEAKETELFIIGGAFIYEQTLEYAHRLYLSKVDISAKADVFFPEYEKFSWQIDHEEHFTAKSSEPAWTYQVLSKKPSKIFS